MEHVPWFRQVTPEDAIAPVTVDRLTRLLSQEGWNVALQGTETRIVASRDVDIVIDVLDDGHILSLDHYGAARYPADLVGEFIVNMNDINAQLEVHHIARLLPAYADDSHICVRAVSRFLTGAGLSDAQILAHIDAAASACRAFVEQFEALKDEPTEHGAQQAAQHTRKAEEQAERLKEGPADA